MPPGCPLVNQIGKAKTFGPQVFDLPSKYGNGVRIRLCQFYTFGQWKDRVPLTQNFCLLFSSVPDSPTDCPPEECYCL